MNTPQQRSEALEKRLISFAVRIVRLAASLPGNFAGHHFGKQIIRSGSSCALNYGEARSAESKKDFRHKNSIVLKELRETHINLRIISQSGLYAPELLKDLIDENNQLISLFVVTIRSLDENLNKSARTKR